MNLPCRLVERVGHFLEQGASWGECSHAQGPHYSREVVGETPLSGYDDLHIDYAWAPAPCTKCGAVYDGSELRRSAGMPWKCNTEDGKLHPGDMYWAPHFTEDNDCWPAGWTNCPGQHLHVKLPNGDDWDIDSRASNCTLPNDTTHRCWVREGEPPKVTAGKAGPTCDAGAGSIQSGGYHGFLRDGEFTP